jgi:hypothetical protein
MARHYLLSTGTFTAALAAAGIGPERVVFEQPADVTNPFVVLRDATTIPIDRDGIAWAPLQQVEALWPTTDPTAKKGSWDLAYAAAVTLGRARNAAYEGCSFSGRVTDGPLSLDDTTRGKATVLRRTLIRVELRVHAL